MLKSLEMGIVDNHLFKTVFTFFVRQTETIYDTSFTLLIKCMKNILFQLILLYVFKYIRDTS